MGADRNDETQSIPDISHLFEETKSDSVFAKLRLLLPRYVTVSDEHFKTHPVTRAAAALEVFKLGPKNPHYCRFAVEVARGCWTGQSEGSLEAYIQMCAAGELLRVKSFYNRLAGVPSRKH